MTLFDVLDVLENGRDCSSSHRKKGMIERCIRSKKGYIKVVLAESYSYDDDEEIWLVVHVGVTR